MYTRKQAFQVRQSIPAHALYCIEVCRGCGGAIMFPSTFAVRSSDGLQEAGFIDCSSESSCLCRMKAVK